MVSIELSDAPVPIILLTFPQFCSLLTEQLCTALNSARLCMLSVLTASVPSCPVQIRRQGLRRVSCASGTTDTNRCSLSVASSTLPVQPDSFARVCSSRRRVGSHECTTQNSFIRNWRVLQKVQWSVQAGLASSTPRQ